MCTITGFWRFKDGNAERITNEWVRLFKIGEWRGRDSFGFYAYADDGTTITIKGIGKVSDKIDEIERHVRRRRWRTLIANNRAEPTTEYVKKKTEKDTHPFKDTYEGVVHIVENGVVPNDKELVEEYGEGESKIDAAVVPNVVFREWDGTVEGMVQIAHIIKGGNAVLGFDERHRKMFAFVTFKPLYYAITEDGIMFASLRSMFDELWSIDEQIKRRIAINKIEPYSVMVIDENDNIKFASLFKNEKKKKKVLVICSGGLDSTTVATKYVREGHEVTLLHFLYGCKAEERERWAITNIAKALGCDVMVVDMKQIYAQIAKGCRLLDEQDIVTERDGEAGAEYAHEWVWARNLVMYAIAIAIAEAKGYDVIASGINLEEAGAYSDNEEEFLVKLRELLPNVIDYMRRIELEAPVVNLVKHEIVRLGLELGAPYEYTWSCYLGGERHCGRCGPCYMRKKAFEINGVQDPVFKEVDEDVKGNSI